MSPAREPVHDGAGGPSPSRVNAAGPDKTAPRRRHALALAVYIALTVVLTWPLARHAGSRVAMHPRRAYMVPYHHIYLIAWYHHVFDQGLTDYWNANVFYPHPRVLTYSENLLAPAALTWPAHLVGQNATLCYNLVVLSAYVLNGLGTYVLALQLGLSWRLALVMGGALAFCPYLIEEIYSPAMLLLYPVPLMLAGLHRLIRRPTWWGVILVGVCGLWLTMSCYQYTLFCSLFCAGWMLWFGRRIPWRRLWYKLLVVGGLCAALVWPLASTVKRTHREMGFSHEPTLPMTWDLMWLPANAQRLYHDLLGIRVREERNLLLYPVCFPGLTFGLLAAIGGWVALVQPARSDEARRRRHTYRFCLAASLAGFLLAMGLWIQLGPVKVPGPYALLYWTLSPFSSVRSVNRFCIFGQLFAAILAGLGLRQCFGSTSTRGYRRFIGLAAVLMLLAESVWIPLNLWDVTERTPATDVRPLYQRLAELDPSAPLIEIPVPYKLNELPVDSVYMLSSIHTWQPLVNGYASFTPGLYEQLRPIMTGFPSPGTLGHLRALGVRYVLVREPLVLRHTAAAIRRSPDLREVKRHRQNALYELRGTNRRSLNDWKGTTRLRIERDPASEREPRAWLEFELDRDEVIPVLPGDWGTRWRLAWRDVSNQVIKTQAVTVRGSCWLTRGQNALYADVEVPARAGTYTVEATDQSDGRKLGACTFEVK